MFKNLFLLMLVSLLILLVLSAEDEKKRKPYQYAVYNFSAGEAYDAMTEATRRIIRCVKDIPDSEVRIIEAEILKKWIDSGETVTLVDVRKVHTFRKSHIKGAVSIPLAEIDSRYREIPWRGKVVLYCGSSNCPLSLLAAKRLLAFGFTNVMDMPEGLARWRILGFPLESI